MTDYIPDSLTEIIIAHGVQSRSLDPELAEIGGLILLESVDATKYPDPKILEYMQQGKNLVSEVLGGIA